MKKIGFLLILMLFVCSTKIDKNVFANVEVFSSTATVPRVKVPPLKAYAQIIFNHKETLTAADGTKSVIFNSDGSKLYAMNLEGMSIYEFDRPSRKMLREFKFKATPGKGWDYDENIAIDSFEEKPVEAAMSHDDKFLWVSLHNAAGIVPIRVDSNECNQKHGGGTSAEKEIYVTDYADNQTDTIFAPLIKTGKTPKVIAITHDNQYLLVSNWHSYNVSVLKLDEKQYPYGEIIATIPVSSIPRGIAIDEKQEKSYVTIMGGASIAVIDNKTWESADAIKVESNPRHICFDNLGRLFVSYNKLAKIACIDPQTGKTLFAANTKAQPRTIALSKNQKFIFVTCYSSNFVDVFKINANGFEKVVSLPCAGKPVGVDIFETDNTLEAWVCSYTSGSITVFNFDKK
jgi:DNA-binding beta-propeller fold protein YncE